MTKATKRNKWYVYLITNGRRTYVGSTTSVTRRIRQHNREISGGARATRKSAGRWKIVCYISGFEDRKEAYRWEAIVKKRARGIFHRTEAMKQVASGKCPPGRVEYKVPLHIELHYGIQET